MKKIILFSTMLVFLLCCNAFAEKNRLYRSAPGDKGKYYLISVKKAGKFFVTTHKRIGVYGTGFSKVKIDCNRRQYQDLGYGEGSISKIRLYPASSIRWTNLITGSSKSDLVNYVCKHYR